MAGASAGAVVGILGNGSAAAGLIAGGALAHRGELGALTVGESEEIGAAPGNFKAFVGALGGRPAAGTLTVGPLVVAGVGRVVNAAALRTALVGRGALLRGEGLAELILQLMAASRLPTVVSRLVEALYQVQGAFSLVVGGPELLVAARDPWGVHPLLLGASPAGPVVASEAAAIRALGGQVVREIGAGELLILDEKGGQSVRPFPPKAPAPCGRERLGLGREDAPGAFLLRAALGRRLAGERSAPGAQAVVAAPGGGAAAFGYAEAAGLPLLPVVGEGPPGELVAGKRLVVVGLDLPDEGLLSGLRAAGALELFPRAIRPATRAACALGVDGLRIDEERGGRCGLAALEVSLGAGACTACFGGESPMPAEPSEGAGQLRLFG